MLMDMAMNDSALDPDDVARIRTLLEPRRKAERMWPVLAAALLAAVCALAFAGAMIVAPPVVTQHVVRSPAATAPPPAPAAAAADVQLRPFVESSGLKGFH
jgi:hypothetical protein